jgi:hypothetical protein
MVMSKRFTDTEKWNDPWFRKLPSEYKLLWLFILDMCDVAGVWKADVELAGHYIMGRWDFYKKDECKKFLGDRIYSFGEGDSERWFVEKFIKFQYIELSPDSKPHNKIINILKDLNLLDRVCHRVSNRVFNTLQDKDIYMDKEKEEEKEGDYKGEFEALWKLYPNKDGRKTAERHFRASVKSDKDIADINKALQNYLSSKKVKEGYIKNGSTWFNNWRDWIDYKEPTKQGVKENWL